MLLRVSRIIESVNSKKAFLFFFFFLLCSFQRERKREKIRTVIWRNWLFASSHLNSIERSWKSANAETSSSRLIDFRQLRAEQTDSHTPLRDYNPQEGSTKGVWHRLPTFLRLPIHSPPGQSSTHRNFESLWITAKPNSVSYVIPRYPDNQGSSTVERIGDD